MRHIVCVIAVATLLTVGSKADGGQPGLRLELESSKAVYAPYEPIVIGYSVANTSQNAVTVPSLIMPQAGWIKFEVAGQNGKFEPYRTGLQGYFGFASTTLKAGERLRSQLLAVTNAEGRLAATHLHVKAELFPFATPGRYSIRATYPLSLTPTGENQPSLASNVVELTVRAPSQKEDAEIRFFANPAELAAAMGADSPVTDVNVALPRWEEFVKAFPASPYTPYVRMTLGAFYLNGPIGSSDPARALAHFRAVAEQGPSSIADDATVELVKSLIDLGRLDEARATLTSGLARFGNSERLPEMARLRDGLNEGLRTRQEIYGK